MSKRLRFTSLALALILLISSLSMTSCIFSMNGEDYMTKAEVQQMINNGMSGNITVEGGDNFDVTINAADRENAAAGKALLSVVSIDCVFKTAYTSSYQPGFSANKEKTSSGSGVIYKLDKNRGDAYIITNYHVVYYNQANTENGISDDITVYLYGQESSDYAIPATYVGGSMNYDLAVLKIDGSRVLAKSNAMAAEISNSDTVAVLDQAIAVGNPEDLGISATLGYVNVDSEYISMEGADGSTTITIRVMRMDTSVNSGNSGGGLFDCNGNLIGIVNAKLTSSENMSYAIPSNFVKYVTDNIIYYCDGVENESVCRCYLGITVAAKELYTVYDKETGRVLKRESVSVSSVDKTGLASGVIKVGDVINTIEIDGVAYEVTRMYAVTDAMLNARVGSIVTVNVTRGNEQLSLNINITESALTKIK